MVISVNSGNKRSRNQEFYAVAQAFLRCAEGSKSFAHRRIAAQWFAQAGDHGAAARTYAQAELFSQAAQHYRLAGMFDEAVDIVQQKEKLIDPKIVTSIISVSRLYYFKEQKIE